MQRVYLEEDLALIQKYFPGARTTHLQTPFDLTPRTRLERSLADSFRDNDPDKHWHGDLQWIH